MNRSGSRLIAWLLALVMILNISPITALAAGTESDEIHVEMEPVTDTLYNYISFDGGNTYLSLNKQDKGITAIDSAKELIKLDPNKKTYALTEGEEYSYIAPYDLKSVTYTVNNTTYVNEKAERTPGQAYFTTVVKNVEAVNAANWRDSKGKLQPAITQYATIDGKEQTFHRNYLATLVIPKTEQPLYTVLTVNVNGKDQYYGIEYRTDFKAIDSRYYTSTGTNHPLSSDLYEVEDFDFNKLDLTIKINNKDVTYKYSADGTAPKDGSNYYTVSDNVLITKTDNTRASNGLLGDKASGWNYRDDVTEGTRHTLKSSAKVNEPGYPSWTGFYHRDYTATLHEGVPVTKHTVHFQYNNNTDPETTVTVIDGETVARPETDPKAPELWNQVFDEWQVNGQAYDFNSPVTSDLWIGATYKAASSNNYNQNNNTEVRAKIEYREKTGQETIGGVDPYSENIHPDHTNADGSRAFVRDGAQNEGKKFSHWTIEINGTEYSLEDTNDTWNKEVLVPRPDDDPFAPTGSDGNKVWTNRQYWAYFSDGSAEDTTTYTLSYKYSGTVPDGAPNAPEGGAYTAGTSVSISQVTDTVDGYTFSGWMLGTESVGETYTMPEENITLTGSWDINSYTITWIDGDGHEDTTTVEYGQVPTHEAVSKTADAQYTYTFTGWDQLHDHLDRW